MKIDIPNVKRLSYLIKIDMLGFKRCTEEIYIYNSNQSKMSFTYINIGLLNHLTILRCIFLPFKKTSAILT